MRDQEQDLFIVCSSKQYRAQQRAALQIEREMRFVTQALGERGIVPVKCIDSLERSLGFFVNVLHGYALHGNEGRAQRGMTFNQRLKRAPQSSLVRFRPYPERRSDVVSHALRRELLEE